MCGRYRIKDTDELTEHLRRTFQIPDWVGTPRFNMAPSQDLPVVTINGNGEVAVPTMRWGFVPYWEKSDKPRLAPINAQAEKVATNAMFRQSVQKRRCLVPADGFYEWKRLDEKTKVPFDIRLKGGRPFFFAGIYEKATETRPATFALLTTRPNDFMLNIHNRMPAILDDDEAQRWLKLGDISPKDVAELTASHPSEDMEANPISNLVNSPRNDLPEILEPVSFIPQPPPVLKATQGELF